MRIDKFLWCVRLWKTRSLAAAACKRGHVRVNDSEAKPSTNIAPGDRVATRHAPIWRSFQVLQMPKSRVGAKLLPELLTEITSVEDLEKYKTARTVQAASRAPRAGRPTKRERRALGRFRSKG